MKKILVVIDMQNDFVDESVLGNNRCKSVIPKIVNKINEEAYKDAIVFATRDTHDENYLNTLEGKNLPVTHCIENTKGWEIVDPIKNILSKRKAKIVNKPTFGSFKLVEEINKIVHNLNEDFEIEICGVCTGICVISNAMMLRAALPNNRIIVDSNCCACVSVETHNNAIEAMKLCQITVI